MKICKMLVVTALMYFALYIFIGTVNGESMWGWIAAYWLVVYVKWLLDFFEHM